MFSSDVMVLDRLTYIKYPTIKFGDFENSPHNYIQKYFQLLGYHLLNFYAIESVFSDIQEKIIVFKLHSSEFSLDSKI